MCYGVLQVKIKFSDVLHVLGWKVTDQGQKSKKEPEFEAVDRSLRSSGSILYAMDRSWCLLKGTGAFGLLWEKTQDRSCKGLSAKGRWIDPVKSMDRSFYS